MQTKEQGMFQVIVTKSSVVGHFPDFNTAVWLHGTKLELCNAFDSQISLQITWKPFMHIYSQKCGMTCLKNAGAQNIKSCNLGNEMFLMQFWEEISVHAKKQHINKCAGII